MWFLLDIIITPDICLIRMADRIGYKELWIGWNIATEMLKLLNGVKKRAENGHPEPYNVKYWEIDNEVWKMDPKLYAEITRLFQ